MFWIGLVFVLYAIIAIIVILFLRQHVSTLLDSLIKSIATIVNNGLAALQPLVRGASSARNAATAVDNAANLITQSFQTIITLLTTLRNQTAPQLDKNRLSVLEIFQPHYLFTAATLSSLEHNDGMPLAIIDKIRDLVGFACENVQDLRDEVAIRLIQSEYTQYMVSIETRAANPEFGNDRDLIATIEGTRLAISHAGNTSLPSAATSVRDMKLPVAALVVLADSAAGPFVPLALSIKQCWIILKEFRRVIELISINIAPVRLANEGDWIDVSVAGHDLKAPGGDLEVPGFSYDFAGKLAFLTAYDIEARVNAFIAAVQHSPDITPHLDDAADKIDELADRLKAIADDQNRLPATIQNIKGATCNLLKSLWTVQIAVNSILKMANDLQIADLLTEFARFSSDLHAIANDIDDGRPIDTPGKNDLVQQATTLLISLNQVIPEKAVTRVVDGVFILFTLVHVAILVVGIIWITQSSVP